MNDDDLKHTLVEADLLSPEDFDDVSKKAVKANESVGKIIIETGVIEKVLFYQTVAKRLGVEYKSILELELTSELKKIYPQELAVSTESLPIIIEDDVLHIAMKDPSNISYIDQVQLYTNYPIEVYLSPPEEVDEAIVRNYKSENDNLDLGTVIDLFNLSNKGQNVSEVGTGDTTSIIKVVDMIIAQAVKDGASDIHIEPEEDKLRVRFRIDGILHEIPAPPKEWELAIISRIKVLTGMDIAESRTPQDGHFQLTVGVKPVDFRVSTLPTIHGENLVLRLLDTSSITVGLEKLGFTTEETLKSYEALISRPYGIVLSTGPTGCGKTTTLYSALARINTLDRNIITLEDPVEYRLDIIRQVQVNPKAGITFANGLRAILRQDPDVIMVGEIRDLETARMAVQAALTGHLVFSTLHTNDSPSAVARLIDMGVEPFLIAASLVGVMAQRLIRTICPDCKKQYKPTEAVLKKWDLLNTKDVKVYKGEGCSTCKGTGYKGRTGLYELMPVDDEMRDIINQRSSTVEIRNKARAMGMQALYEDGRAKVLKGITTFEEVARVCEDYSDVQSVAPTRVKPKEVEVKRYIESAQDQRPEPIVIDEKQTVDDRTIKDYQSRMKKWLGGKR